jgi:4-amino-4-deoxy-L-arabinose transferase-like glycosyltransferase
LDKAYRRSAAFVILGGLALRIALAAVLPLTVDGNYAIAAAREFSISFFDHPPLGFWLPGWSADLFAGQSALIFRLPFLLMGAVTACLLFRIGEEAGGSRAGLWTALLFTLAPFFSLFSGVFILPDGPLNLFLALTVLLLLRCLNAPQASLWQWAGAGWALALALASKYQALLLPVAVLAFMLWQPEARRLLARPGPYVAAAVAAIGLAPALVWNLEHDWASLAFHAGRVGEGLQLAGFLLNFAGQAIYLLPPTMGVAFPPMWSALVPGADWRRAFLAFAALGPILLFNIVYLFSAGALPHWAMPGWLFALPLAGSWIVQSDRRAAISRWALTAFAVPIWLAVFAIAIQARTGWLTVGYDEPPRWDNTSEIFDWSGLEPALAESGLLAGADFLGVTSWIDGGRFSTALGGTLPVVVLEGDPHHFGFMDGAAARGEGLVLVTARVSEPDQLEAAVARLEARYGNAISLSDTIELSRGSRPYMVVAVMRLTLE